MRTEEDGQSPAPTPNTKGCSLPPRCLPSRSSARFTAAAPLHSPCPHRPRLPSTFHRDLPSFPPLPLPAPIPIPVPVPAAPRLHRDAPPVSTATTTHGGLARLPGGCLSSGAGAAPPGIALAGIAPGKRGNGTRDAGHGTGGAGPLERLHQLRAAHSGSAGAARSGPGGAFPGSQRAAGLFRRHLGALGVRRSGAAGRERGRGVLLPLWGRRRARGS